MKAAHGEGARAGGVAKAGEVKHPVENVGEEFVAKAQAVSLPKSRRHVRADDNFPMGKGENVGWGGVPEMALVEPAAFAGGDKNDADFPR